MHSSQRLPWRHFIVVTGTTAVIQWCNKDKLCHPWAVIDGLIMVDISCLVARQDIWWTLHTWSDASICDPRWWSLMQCRHFISCRLSSRSPSPLPHVQWPVSDCAIKKVHQRRLGFFKNFFLFFPQPFPLPHVQWPVSDCCSTSISEVMWYQCVENVGRTVQW